MGLLIGISLSFVVAAAIGLGSTWFALTRNVAFGAMSVGAWTAHPTSGGVEIDPYARASAARSGELLIGLGDGVTFIAKADDAGRALDGRCEVRLSGTTPQARYFTLTLYDPDGELIANSLHRHGFTSQELLRKANGHFDVVIAPRARPGNWIPTSGVQRYVLAMRFYDTPIGVSTRAERENPMPAIQMREPCP